MASLNNITCSGSLGIISAFYSTPLFSVVKVIKFLILLRSGLNLFYIVENSLLLGAFPKEINLRIMSIIFNKVTLGCLHQISSYKENDNKNSYYDKSSFAKYR